MRKQFEFKLIDLELIEEMISIRYEIGEKTLRVLMEHGLQGWEVCCLDIGGGHVLLQREVVGSVDALKLTK